jgi:hypothetical protein
VKREPRDAHLAMIAALREKRALSDKTRSRCELVAADMMEIDACRQLGGLDHPSANAHLWMDSRGRIHAGRFP